MFYFGMILRNFAISLGNLLYLLIFEVLWVRLYFLTFHISISDFV